MDTIRIEASQVNAALIKEYREIAVLAREEAEKAQARAAKCLQMAEDLEEAARQVEARG